MFLALMVDIKLTFSPLASRQNKDEDITLLIRQLYIHAYSENQTV